MPARYKYVKRKYHPLAPAGGRFPEHRLVLWEKIGPGTHPCFRCGTPVTWSDRRTAPGALTVNHMDLDTRNNAPSNLEPSCHSCNIAHGRDERFNGLFLVVGGKRSRAVERVCQRASCGKTFLIEKKAVDHAERAGRVAGRFCSRRCLYDRNK